MLKSIDTNRQIQEKIFINFIKNLKWAVKKLFHTLELLRNSSVSKNAFEILTIHEEATQTLKLVQAMKPEILPPEEEFSMFLPPDNGILRSISSLFLNSNLTTPIFKDSPPPSPPNPICCPKSKSRSPSSTPSSPTRSIHSPSSKLGPCPGFPPDSIPIEKYPIQIPCMLRSRPIYNVNKRLVAKFYRTLPETIIGNTGSNDGQLCRPWGVCCDYMGNIIVADRSNNRIQIFGSRGKLIHKFGDGGYGIGQFKRPAGVALSPANEIVVADKDNHRIQIFKMDGTFVRTFGEKGSRNGQFFYPWDVACNSVGHIVVSDARNHRIQLFTAEGRFLNKYGFDPSGPLWKHFDCPRGVCFTPGGHIVVTDFNNHRIVVVDALLANARYLGKEGTAIKFFQRPQGVICDDFGNLVVADSRNYRIQVFDKNGIFLWAFGSQGIGPGQLDRPSGICLSPEGKIIVVDFGNDRVQIF